MIDFLSRFFRREEASKTLAKERLRLILMSDRVSLAPDVFEAMKGEMLDVLRRYLEIDERGMDVHFENAERQFALLANIPVREVRTHDAIALARTASYSAKVEEPASYSSPLQTDPIDAAPAEPARPRRRRRRRSRASSSATSQA
ncbi:MAG TPA: cell division topological specificity factor MinE, partial [Candidatus Eremiobacteraceae bacterium]|nr:cell division topological specificity factor MinE [Candidatus Eremiobacteraceae bacterium]